MGRFDFVMYREDTAGIRLYLAGVVPNGQAFWTSNIHEALRVKTPDHCDMINRAFGLGGPAVQADRGFT